MNRPLFVLLLCLLSGAPARAALELDAPRTQAQEARGRVRELRTQQQTLRAELNTLAGRIAQLKSGQRGPLVAGSELEKALRRSQELSGALTTLAQSLASAEGEAERRHLALHTALSEELARLRADWDATSDRRAREPLLERMRALRTERDAIRTALPAAQMALPPEPSPRDDAEELLQQADALRDTGDKVAQRLQALRARLTEVREERELDRRMNDFLGEESMFDEQDRRLNVTRDSLTQKYSVNETPRQGASKGEVFASPAPTVSNPTLPSPPDTGGGNGGGGGGGNGNNSGIGGISSGDSRVPPSPAAADSRPQVGTVRAQVLASDLPEDPRAMEQEAARLEALARELDARAKALEHRARELR